jgi:hypothetical protein
MTIRNWWIPIAGLILLMGLVGQFAIRQAGKLDAAVENKSGSDKTTQDLFPPCWDPMPPASKDNEHRLSNHSVTLSWKASVPVSKSPQDAVKGYYIYRSPTSLKHTLSYRMNAQPIVGTGCMDRAVEANTTYFYSVRALSHGGAQSIFSQEVKAVVPSP